MRSELADLFELMHGAPDSFRTLRAVIRTTSDYEPLRSAQAREFEEADPDGWAAYVAEGGESGRGCCWFDCDYTTTLWIESPSAIREESDLPGDEVRVTRDAGQHPAPSAYPDLLDPLVLVPAVHLEVDGEDVVADRDGVRLRAHPRTLDDPIGLSWLSNSQADAAELVVDRECGILLRRTSVVGGTAVETVEVTELDLDVALDPALFDPVPPADDDGSEHVPAAMGQLTLEQAAAQVSFTVFALPVIWPRAQLDVSMLGGGVWVTYSDWEGVKSGSPARTIWFTQYGDPQNTWIPERPDRIELDGVEALAWVGGATLTEGRVSFPRSARLVREGTHIELTAEGVGREEFFGLVRSLAPVG